jgi:ribosome-binding protein aMBF1 (putative translation factor)
MVKTKDALKIIDRITGEDQELKRLIAEETVNAQVAQMIYEARTKAGLTQGELAKLVRTRPSVIARLEEASYEGQSLTMLQRIAAALDKRLEIRFLPIGRKLKAA